MHLTAVSSLLLFAIASVAQVCKAAEMGGSAVVEAHNAKRRLESSSNMKLLSWDLILEATAADHADQCNFNHDPNIKDGENLYVTSVNFSSSVFEGAVNSWYKEKDDYTLDITSCAEGKACGHYTAIVWANTERVGCAARYCSNGITGIEWTSGTIVVCRYAPPGNFASQMPYKKGTACSDCDVGWKACTDGLCTEGDAPVETTSTSSATLTATTLSTASSTSTMPSSPTHTATISTTVKDGGVDEQSTSTRPDTSSTSTMPSYSTHTATSTATDGGVGGQSTTTISDGHEGSTTTTVSGGTQSPVGSCTAEYLDALSAYRESLADWQRVMQDYRDVVAGENCQ